jgi:hypothetical protein
MGEQTLLDSVLWHIRSWDEIKRTSLFTLANYANVFLLVGFVIFAIIQTRSKIVRGLSLRLHLAAAVMIYLYLLSRSFVLTCPLSSESVQRGAEYWWAGSAWLPTSGKARRV